MKPSSKKDKVPYSRKPSGMSVDEWQTQLRKQYAGDQRFKIKNIGNHPFFSDFEVFNSESLCAETKNRKNLQVGTKETY